MDRGDRRRSGTLLDFWCLVRRAVVVPSSWQRLPCRSILAVAILLTPASAVALPEVWVGQETGPILRRTTSGGSLAPDVPISGVRDVLLVGGEVWVAQTQQIHRFDAARNPLGSFSGGEDVTSLEFVAEPPVVFFVDEAAWAEEFVDHEIFWSTPQWITDWEGITEVPDTDDELGPGLAALAFNARIQRSILITLNQANAEWIYNDSPGPTNPLDEYVNALSAGHIDVHEQDDWQLQVLEGPPLTGFGVSIRDNQGAGDRLCVYAEGDDSLLGCGTVPHDPDPPDVLDLFFGVVADEPIGRIEYLSSGGGDDIAISRFLFDKAIVACNDGIDNDLDGLVDAIDPGCRDNGWPTESPECDDGTDNDGDGGTDWDGVPPDPQCIGRTYGTREQGCGLGGEAAGPLALLLLWRSRRGASHRRPRPSMSNRPARSGVKASRAS